MELPNCPNCGDGLRLESPRGPARCQSCGFLSPVEVDGEALSRLLEDASARGLGPRPSLAPGHEAPEPRLEDRKTPSMLEGSSAPQPPRLSPPPVPEELVRGAPPPMAEPRAPMQEEGERSPETPLKSSLDESRDRSKDRLRPRGELLR